jgi:protein arginine kinase activator
MLCCACKEKPATVHLTQIVGDKMQKLDLCEECAKAKGINDPTAFSLADADVLFGLGASQEIEQAGGGVEAKCSRCGFTQADFKKSGRLGCPECYHTFAEGLDGLLKSMHKGTHHSGKVPEALRANREQSDQLKSLQKKLAKAIEEENFEQAAQLRDEIKQITPRGTGLSVS